MNRYLQIPKKDLKKALLVMDKTWNIQNNFQDKNTGFIYNCNSVDDCINTAKANNTDINYALHRWYNYVTSKSCEEMFTNYGAKPAENKKSKLVDIYLKNIPFDVKVSVFPAKLYKNRKEYNLSTRDGKNKMLKWMYENQSQTGRKEYQNRIIILCDGKSPKECMNLKADYEKINNKIKLFVDYYKEKDFNCISLPQNDVFADIIVIN